MSEVFSLCETSSDIYSDVTLVLLYNITHTVSSHTKLVHILPTQHCCGESENITQVFY